MGRAGLERAREHPRQDRDRGSVAAAARGVRRREDLRRGDEGGGLENVTGLYRIFYRISYTIL